VRRHRPQPSTPEVIERLALAVAGGDPAALAVRRAMTDPPPGWERLAADTLSALDRGHRLSEVLTTWRQAPGRDLGDVVDVLMAAERDGGPLAPVLDQLAGEARAQRRRDAQADARRLPVRLAAPLVLCTLPSFVLLGIVPLVAGALASLQLDLPKGTP